MDGPWAVYECPPQMEARYYVYCPKGEHTGLFWPRPNTRANAERYRDTLNRLERRD